MKSLYYQDRLYVNNGKGLFTQDSLALPDIKSSGSCVISADIDMDGDMDLFVGGRVKPRQYPATPESYLLLNESDGGKIKFVDVTDSLAPGLKKAGMVSCGLFTDFNNDGWIDLIIAGEWMPISFYENDSGSFRRLGAETGLNFSNGWWNSINGTDFDKDGDIDYIAGNLGLNTLLKASRQEPLTLYADDFDQDGLIDPLIFSHIKDRTVPFHPRNPVVSQLKYLAKKFPTFSDFAAADLNDILNEDQLKRAMELNCYELRSCYLENLGNEKFKMTPLPIITQVSPVYGILINDFDYDGYFDALLVGNSKASNLTIGWYDASIGYFLKGHGDGTFTVINGTKSHFFVDSYAKSMVQIKGIRNEPWVIVANTDDSLEVFRRKFNLSTTVICKKDALYGYLVFEDKSRQKIEFYKGSGYLSAQGNTFFPGSNVKSIQIYNSLNKQIQSISFDLP